jgi:hypothetical protein
VVSLSCHQHILYPSRCPPQNKTTIKLGYNLHLPSSILSKQIRLMKEDKKKEDKRTSDHDIEFMQLDPGKGACRPA